MAAAFDFAPIRALTFDCYGTLIDWETGLLRALAPLRVRIGGAVGDEEILSAYAAAETREEARTPGKPYPLILETVYRTLARHWNVSAPDDEAAQFGRSVPTWPPFADTTAALRRLQARFQLCILSNVDHASFAGSERAMGIAFDLVVTAEDVRSYKPNVRNFRALLERLADRGIGAHDILHVAESRYHDHAPAQALGLNSCWIDRRAGRGGGASTPHDVAVTPVLSFTTLAALADAAGV
jgi:2-haloalkanoic acid dehalogenase type II